MAKEKTVSSKSDVVGFRAVQTKRLYQQIAEQIESYVTSGGLKPGDRLPSEREMAVMFGVSRPSVREAMISLEGAGLIEVRTGDGTFVSGVRPPETRFGVSNIQKIGPGVLEQFEARKVLEPALAAMATHLIGESELKILRAAVDEAEDLFRQDKLADEADYSFHVQLAYFSGNRILADVVRELWDLRASEVWQVIRTRVATREHRLEAVSRRRTILQAIEARDAALVRNLVKDMLDWATNRYFRDDAG